MSQKEQLREKFARGMESLAQADFHSAIEIFEEVLKADPNHARAWSQLGLCFLEMREHGRAREALKRSVAADPGMRMPTIFWGMPREALGTWRRRQPPIGGRSPSTRHMPRPKSS